MTEVVQDQRTDESQFSGERWMAIIFNNPTNTFDEVIEIVMIATHCELEEAITEVWEADHYGKAAVHFSSQSECERVANIVSSIGVKTEVAREWSE